MKRPTVPPLATDYRLLAIEGADVATVATVEGVFRYVSPSSEAMFGWTPSGLQGRRYDEFAHPGDVMLLQTAWRELGPDASVTTTIYRFLCPDGSYRWTEARSRLVGADGSLFVVTYLRDISERKLAEEMLQRQALTDSLTGVSNRAVLMDRLHQALRRQARGRGVLTVLFLDLDRFKMVNDSLGHHVGDAMLKDMAERLAGQLRPADTLARLGGDEFVIVAEDVADEAAAVELGQRIAEAGRVPFQVGGEEFVCTLSVGIACTADSEYSAESLLQEADLALYRAKDRGRDRAEVFDDELRTRAIKRLATERVLREAIANQHLVVEYQPIVDLSPGHAISAEALVRIDTPDGVRLLPEAFLQVAEESGLLVEIDEWVFSEAIRRASEWHRRFAGGEFTHVSVNITGRHLADIGFAAGVVAALDNHRLPHDFLHLEFNERALMEASHSALTALRSLRDAGVRVGLDDFGTGYSSLGHLRQFPLDFVKIDRSLIHGNTAVEAEETIVAAIVRLCHALQLFVVAEGVETADELEFLRSVGCDRVQGFLIGRPDDAATLDRLLIATRAGAHQHIDLDVTLGLDVDVGAHQNGSRPRGVA